MREKTLKLEINGKDYTVTINEFSAYEAVVTLNDKTYTVGLKDLGIEQVSDLQPRSAVETAVISASPISSPAPVISTGPAPKKPVPVAGASSIVAPLPGLILKIHVKPGDAVKAGQNLVVMEAMKMENDVQAPGDGTVKSILIKVGDSANEGDVLIELA
ncbi:biotin/lipoyl-binding protein [bacterium]|nr:biotin/lipoyl-binding protein [bacterium]MBU1634697.1 biotin/lipoyl-binding protein [bacterium]MBU1872272.1 biotin/lipoyl-binding protein [bacterium]